MFEFAGNSYDNIAAVRVSNEDSDLDDTTSDSQSFSRSSKSVPAIPASPAPSSSYNTFGSLTRTSDDSGVAAWLRVNNFDSRCISKLAHFTGADLLSLSKADIRELLGVKDGLRLHARLVQVREALAAAGHDPVAEMALHREILQNASLLSTPTRKRERGDSRRRNTQPCERVGCGMGSAVRCCVETCATSLCLEHCHKDIITGYSYCEGCAETMSYTKNFSHLRINDYCQLQ